MQLATWNLNSLNVRLPHVLDWLAKNPVDALALQELKIPDERFPLEQLEAIGYHCQFLGQKTYNGVALLTKKPVVDVVKNMPNYPDEQSRLIAGTLDETRIIGVYCPNGGDLDSSKYSYKLEWFAALTEFVKDEMQRHPKLLLTGDFNIIPRPEDSHDPEKLEGGILASPAERQALQNLIKLGLTDCWTLFPEREGRHRYTWWDYRGGSWPRNTGMRIDHLLASQALADNCQSCEAHVGERGRKRPSDHVPVVGEFK